MPSTVVYPVSEVRVDKDQQVMSTTGFLIMDASPDFMPRERDVVD